MIKTRKYKKPLCAQEFPHSDMDAGRSKMYTFFDTCVIEIADRCYTLFWKLPGPYEGLSSD